MTRPTARTTITGPRRTNTPARTAARLGALSLLAAATLTACSSADGTAPPTVTFASLSGAKTSITLSQGFLSRIDAHHVTPTTTGTASDADEHLYFPITAGTLTTSKDASGEPHAVGTIRHQGSGITLTRGKDSVAVRDLRIDLDRDVITATIAVNQEPAHVDVAFLSLVTGSGSHAFSITRTGGAVVLTGAAAEFSGSAARIIGRTFGPHVVPAGLELGDTRIEVHE